LRHLPLIVLFAAFVTAAAATPGSAASFNDSAPCPASGPLLVCATMHVGQGVDLQLLAHDGCDVYWWEIVNGGLPAGLSMSRSGLVTGTPTKPQTTEPWVWVHDLTASEGGPSWCGGDNHSERQFVFTVDGPGGAPDPGPAPAPAPPPQPPLTITTDSIPTATVGTSYTATLAASGASSFSWTISAGSLPPGLTLGSDGALRGTPTGAGTYTFTVRVDAGGRSASKQLQLVVAEKLTATAPAAQTWEVGRPLQVAIDAKGGTPGYSWKFTGALPQRTGFVGDKGNGSTSYLQGVPAEAGAFSIVLTVTDSAGESTQLTVTLAVAPKLQIRTFRVGTARAGKRFQLAFLSAGGVGGGAWTVAAGSLPSGLKLDPKTGVVSGIARRVGRFRFTVALTDSLGAKAAMTYTLRVKR
jgi:putative Ig domain-containing protein